MAYALDRGSRFCGFKSHREYQVFLEFISGCSAVESASVRELAIGNAEFEELKVAGSIPVTQIVGR
jgi:hypothetical protein